MPNHTAKDHPNRVPDPAPPDPARAHRDLERVATNAKARLYALGVPAVEDDSPDDLVLILEAIERFENVVRSRGGDLMVDEPPPGSRAQPDGEANALPVRAESEPASLYIERLDRASELASIRPE